MHKALQKPAATMPDLSDPLGPGNSIGAALRKRRKALKLSMQTVANGAGLSVGFISQVERGLSAPSLASLRSLAAILDLPISSFLEGTDPSHKVTKGQQRQSYSLAGDARGYERLSTTFPGSKLHSLIVHEPPGHGSETSSHQGEELFYMLSGALTIHIDDETHVLSAGDTLHFDAARPHSTWNHGEEVASFVWCGTMDVFKDRSLPSYVETDGEA